jgi:Uma2 family endonuclease
MNGFMQSSLPPRHPIDVDAYYRMAEEGLLAPEARVELIEGEIVEMPPIGSHHAARVNRLARAFHGVLCGQALLSTRSPLLLSRFSEPQPDLALLKVRDDEYEESHPGAEEVLLIVEVSDSSLRFDRNTKIPLYAKHQIPEVWIVDLQGRQLLVHRTPADGGYCDVSAVSGGVCSPVLAPDVQIDLSDLL